MDGSLRRGWVPAVILLGLGYALVGILFAVPSSHARAWRLAAWIVSAVGFAGHVAFERVRLGNSARSSALHVALAVALGAFGLAVGANLHALASGTSGTHRHLLLLALGIWPVLTALPAFLVALAAGAILPRALRGSRP